MKLLSVRTLALALCACVLIEESFAQRPRIRRPGIPRRTRRPGARTRRPRPIRRTTTQAPLNCPPIPHVDNGQGLDTGSTVRYACEPGYVLEGTNVITCENGRWTVAPRCRRQLCPRPANIPFANQPVFSNGGVSATYTCIAGYRIQGGNGVTSTTVNCNIQSQFWPTLPVCERIPDVGCSGPPSIPNALSTVSGNTAVYRCVTGYILRTGTPRQIQCTGNRWPTFNLPVCDRDPNRPVDTICTKAPPCGDSTITREAAGDAYAVGGKVSYTCITGYRIVGSNDNSNNTAHVFCQADGTWTVTPTCEPVNCGVPPAGTNTIAVVASSITFPNSYTYVCLTNFESGSSLESKCLADGAWSLTPAPTCTQKVCPMSALATLANADFLPQDVPIGNTITYTCKSDYRLAPGSPTSIARTQTVRCLANGTFTALTHTCVYVRPESCRDYFARDNLFSAATIGCITITVDPQGPGISDPNNPDPFQVQCCKTSATQYCTQVSPSSGTTTRTDGTPCTGTAPDVLLPTTTLTAGTSGRCGSTVAVVYPITNTQIENMISSTNGSCSQVTNINCLGTADSLSVAVRVNGETSGVMYGTGAFFVNAPVGFGANNFAYMGGACDCGRTQEASTLVGVTNCPSTCRCTTEGAVGANNADTITKALVTPNPAFVTHFQILQHEQNRPSTPAVANDMTVSIGPIQCCETF